MSDRHDRLEDADSGELSRAVRRRIEFERLFGVEEVYVNRKRRARAGPEGGGAGPDEESGAAGDPGDGDTGTRRRDAVEAARSRARRARPSPRDRKKDVAAEGPKEWDFSIEELPSSYNDLSLFSEAERAGIPRVSSERGPKADRLARLCEAASACTRCRLAEGRNAVVFGEGDPGARLVFVGEGPGAEEDRTGRPFVGRAGKLLTKIIEAMGYDREDVYICNIVKCRPPGNRTPRPDEVASCSPFLHEQIAVIGPKAICALGGPATSTLLETREGITRMRGRLFWHRGIPLMPTFHPAYLLRNAREKGKVWEDMQKLRDFIAGRR